MWLIDSTGVQEMNDAAAGKARDAEKLRVNEQKWTKTLMEAGWTLLPNVIVERQKALGLDPLDVNILMHLASYWWTPDNRPHPSKGTIADAIGVDPRTVQKRIAAMEAAGFIMREERRIPGQGSKSNIYHFDGLIKAATPFAQERIEEKTRREAEKKARTGRKKPLLQLVPKDKE
jgi:predicted transcriptional regulator